MDGGMIQALQGFGQSMKQQQGGLLQMGIGFFGGRRARKAVSFRGSSKESHAKAQRTTQRRVEIVFAFFFEPLRLCVGEFLLG